MRLIEDQSDFLEEDINPIIMKYQQDGYVIPPEVFETLSDEDQKTWYKLKLDYDKVHPPVWNIPIVTGRVDPVTGKTLFKRSEVGEW